MWKHLQHFYYDEVTNMFYSHVFSIHLTPILFSSMETLEMKFSINMLPIQAP